MDLILENFPPFSPGNPSPANDEVEVPVPGGSTTLVWTGGDPDTGDTVIYDVLYGTSTDNLGTSAGGLESGSYQISGLAEGVMYYWQVIARDAAGLVANGPIWRFTTLALPDLVISSLNVAPSGNPEAGQTVTFTATVENTGSAPSSSPFQVGFQIDGANIGSQTVTPTLGIGESSQVMMSWTAQLGDHTLSVTADAPGDF